MSIEIEVGLENATRIPISPEPPKPVAPKGFANPRVQKMLLAGGIVALLVVAALLFYYHDRESTDDAQVDGHITPIAAKISGRVQEVLVTDNQAVKAGQILLKIDPRDYQAAVDQAQAALDVAESDALSAGADVPRTKADVASGNSSGVRASQH
jgi:membrane fusion protein, multidrug efflux system